MTSHRCRVCDVELAEPYASYCSEYGHAQYDYIFDEETLVSNLPESQPMREATCLSTCGEDEDDPDDSESSDDEPVEISAYEWERSANSKRQTMQMTRQTAGRYKQSGLSFPITSSSSVNRRSVQVHERRKESMDKSERADWAKKAGRSGLSYQLKPISNSFMNHKVNFWRCQPHPARPESSNTVFLLRMDRNTPLETPEQIHEWIMRFASAKGVREDILGRLEFDPSRKAAIGRKPPRCRIPEDIDFSYLHKHSVRDLVHEFSIDRKQADSVIHFLVPARVRSSRSPVSTSTLKRSASVQVEESTKRRFQVWPTWEEIVASAEREMDSNT